MNPSPWIVALALSVGPSEEPSIVERFEALHAAEDEAGIEELFRARPFEVVYLIDDYLTEWLALVDQDARQGDPQRPFALAAAAAGHADDTFGTDAYGKHVGAREKWSSEERDRFREAEQRYRRGRDAQKARDYDAAREAYQHAVDVAAELGDGRLLGLAAQKLGDLAIGAGDLEAGVEHHERALALLTGLRHPGLGRSCRALAFVHEREGRLAEARRLLEQMLEAAKLAGREEKAAPVRNDLARLCRALGDDEAAERYEKDG